MLFIYCCFFGYVYILFLLCLRSLDGANRFSSISAGNPSCDRMKEIESLDDDDYDIPELKEGDGRSNK